MKRKWLAIEIIVLLLGTCIIPATAQNTEKTYPASKGTWLYVGGSGPGNYTRIQNAIANSSDGDTIYVFDESSPYIENIKVYNEIHLIGEDKNSTELKGFNPNDEVIAITTAGFVTISGFTITTETSNIGIQIYTSYNTISGNIFKDNSSTFETSEIGIVLLSSSRSCMINKNIFQNTSKGIRMEGSSFNTIRNNSFDKNCFGIISFYGREHTIDNNTMKNGSWGMLLSCFNASSIIDNIITSYENYGIEIGTRCSNNRILRNTISLCREGIRIGSLSDGNKIQNNSLQQNLRGIVISLSSNYNLIEKNEIIENRDYGIRILGSYNKVQLNVIKDNEESGILIQGQNNDIYHNLIENNSKGVYLQGSNYNRITCNNFIRNEGFFIYSFKNHWSIKNVWDNNYWETLNGNFKFIVGRLKIVLYTWTNWLEKQTYEIAVYPLRFNVDWHPAQEPYDIPEVR